MTNEHLGHSRGWPLKKKILCSLDNNMIINKVCEKSKTFFLITLINYIYKSILIYDISIYI
jgi:hypothetical protein